MGGLPWKGGHQNWGRATLASERTKSTYWLSIQARFLDRGPTVGWLLTCPSTFTILLPLRISFVLGRGRLAFGTGRRPCFVTSCCFSLRRLKLPVILECLHIYSPRIYQHLPLRRRNTLVRLLEAQQARFVSRFVGHASARFADLETPISGSEIWYGAHISKRKMI